VIWSDLRFGFRQQMRTPASSAALVLTLALGIAATSVAFSATNTMFLSPLSAERPNELVRIYDTSTSGAATHLPTSYPDYLDIRNETAVFSGVVAEQPVPYNMGSGTQVERVWAQLVAGGYFSVLGVGPSAGRLFSPDEERIRGGEPIAVMSDAFWRERFGASPSAIGSSILLNGHPVRIIGVAAPRFHGTTPGFLPDLWVPVMVADRLYPVGDWLERRGTGFFFLTGRLRPGVSLAEARVAIDRLSEQLQRDHIANQGVRFAVLSESESRMFPMFARQVMGLSAGSMATAFLVLLVACSNVAGVLLVRASARRKEMGVRLALGATRGQLVRQLLAEHGIFSLAAGLIGLGAAVLAARTLSSIHLPIEVPLGMDFLIDTRVLGFSFVITVATGVLFGLAPALEGARVNPIMLMKDGGEAEAPRQSRTRAALVTAQVAVSAVLLLAAGLFIRNLQNAKEIDLGFEPKGAVMTSIDLGMQHYSIERAREFWPRLTARLDSDPSLASSALVTCVPLELNLYTVSLAPEGYTPPSDGSWPLMGAAAAGPRFFRVMGTPLIAGREFDDRDRHGAPYVVVINDTAARQFWTGQHAVGRRLQDRAGTLFEVVGVVKTAKYLTIGEDPKPYIYFALHQSDARRVTVVARERGDQAAALKGLGDVLRSLEPAAPLYDVRTLATHAAVALTPAQGSVATFAIVGTIALLLTAIGLYGTIAYAVSRRTYEIGVRRALGAADRDVARLVIGDASTLVIVGLVCGGGAALALFRVLRSFLYDINSIDPLVIAGAGAALVTACAAAAWVPARRAIRVEAVKALRSQ
jgi:predicted permease